MRLFFAVVVMSVVSVSVAEESKPLNTEPIIVDGKLVIPEGVVLPRYETRTERLYRELYPPSEEAGVRAVSVTPTGPLHCVAEYEPMEGLCIGWRAFNSGTGSILANICREVTTTAASRVYVIVNMASEQSTATTTLTNAGCNMTRVQFIIRTLDSVWIRDYGPRYVYEGDCRVIVDHLYNRPTRVNDNAFPGYFAGLKKQGFYELGIAPNQLRHGGGNYHLDALQRSYATKLVYNENNPPAVGYSWTEQQIHDIWMNYQGVDTHLFDPFPTSVDSTQHLDMWMQVFDDDKVMISDWPNNAGSTQDNICDNAAVFMANRGYTVHRIPARSISGVHYTYTNVVMINNLVLIPSYTNATIVNAGHNGQALTAWQNALPGKTIVPLNAQDMVSLAGVFHCIVMHVPVHRGGVNPTVYLRSPRKPQDMPPAGNNVEIRWISDDDVGTSNVDIRMSTNGGASYDTVVASATPDDGSHTYLLPNICNHQVRFRVIARDASGNTGFDSSPVKLAISAVSPMADMNCDCARNVNDIAPFTMALLDPAAYAVAFPSCNLANADLNGDGVADGRDIALFIDSLVP